MGKFIYILTVSSRVCKRRVHGSDPGSNVPEEEAFLTDIPEQNCDNVDSVLRSLIAWHLMSQQV